MSFTREEVYGVTCIEFCERTGTQLQELIIRYKKEITMLEVNLAVRRSEYRSGGKITDDEQRYREKLIRTIEKKIKGKKDRIKEFEKYMESK